MFADNATDVTPAALARRRINTTLRGPVLYALTGLMPELAGLPPRRAYETILGDCDLLHRCFQTFRARRTAFRHVLVDRRGRPVISDNQPLDCGRTLNQVIAMVVRSAAKRHFRLRLDPWRQYRDSAGERFETQPQPGWSGMLERVMANRRLATASAHPPSAADILYDAIKDYLLHDWQVPIIPQYARLSPAEVRDLGSRLLDFRDAKQMATHLDGGEVTRWPVGIKDEAAAAPSMETTVDRRTSLGDVLTTDGSRLSMRAVVPILQTPEIHALMQSGGHEAMRDLCRTLSATGARPARCASWRWISACRPTA